MDPEPPCDILLVGQTADLGLEFALEATLAIAASESLRVGRADDIRRAIERLRPEVRAPWLIVVLQNWPGEVAAAEVDRLRRAAPLATLCGLLGSWCEGETRSGKPWPGALRVAWRQWPAQLARECQRTRRGVASEWSLPSTSSVEELLLADASRVADGGSPARAGALIAILAEGHQTQAALADAARGEGYRTAIVPALSEGDAPWRLVAPSRAPAATTPMDAAMLLWDASARTLTDSQQVRRATSRAPGAPIVALVGFPRADDVALARAAGVSAVIAKPYLLSEVFWWIEELLERDPQTIATPRNSAAPS